MATSARSSVGFSMHVRLEWLERTAQLLLVGQGREQIQETLHELLRDQAVVGEATRQSEARQGVRGKTVGNLMKIWVSVPPPLEGLRDDGLELLRRLPEANHLAVHWGMTLAVYPFVGTVAEAMGRLLRLQGTVSSVQVRRRLCEQMGQRPAVERAVQRVFQTFHTWGVLRDPKGKSVFEMAPPRPVTDAQLAAWLMEAVLMSSGAGASSLDNLARSPLFFPFALGIVNARWLENQPRVDVLVQGLDQYIVTLRSRPASHNGARPKPERAAQEVLAL